MAGREVPRRAPLRRRCRRAPPESGPRPASWLQARRSPIMPLRRRDQRHVQRHHVGGGQQLLERHRLGAQRLRLLRVAGRRIVKAMRQPMRWNACATAVPIVPNRPRPPAGPPCRRDCRPACGCGKPRSCLGRSPHRAQAKRRSSSDAAVTAYSATALLLPPGNVGDRNAEPRQRGLVEPVEAGAGDLDELEVAVLEQGGGEFRSDGGNDQRGACRSACGTAGSSGLRIGHLQRRRRQRVDAREIGFRPQAKNWT